MGCIFCKDHTTEDEAYFDIPESSEHAVNLYKEPNALNIAYVNLLKESSIKDATIISLEKKNKLLIQQNLILSNKFFATRKLTV